MACFGVPITQTDSLVFFEEEVEPKLDNLEHVIEQCEQKLIALDHIKLLLHIQCLRIILDVYRTNAVLMKEDKEFMTKTTRKFNYDPGLMSIISPNVKKMFLGKGYTSKMEKIMQEMKMIILELNDAFQKQIELKAPNMTNDMNNSLSQKSSLTKNTQEDDSK